MKLKLITQCETLNFTPYAEINSISPIAHSGYIITGFQHNHDYALEVDDSIEVLLKKIYPKLSLIELSKLHKALLKAQLPINEDAFFQLYNLKWSEDLQETLDSIENTSEEFQLWAHQKSVSVSELRILNYALQKLNSNQVNAFLNLAVQTFPSRQIGVKIFEYAFEIFDNHNFSDIFDEILKINSPDTLHNYFYEKRFPQTVRVDTEYSHKTKKIPWPAHVKAQWVRNGDSSGLELKFFSSNAQDFRKKISRLNELLEKTEKELWS